MSENDKTSLLNRLTTGLADKQRDLTCQANERQKQAIASGEATFKVVGHETRVINGVPTQVDMVDECILVFKADGHEEKTVGEPSDKETYVTKISHIVSFIQAAYPEALDNLEELFEKLDGTKNSEGNNALRAMFSYGSKGLYEGQTYSGRAENIVAVHYLKGIGMSHLAKYVPQCSWRSFVGGTPVKSRPVSKSESNEIAELNGKVQQVITLCKSLLEQAKQTKGDKSAVYNGAGFKVKAIMDGFNKEAADKAREELTKLAEANPLYKEVIMEAVEKIPMEAKHNWTAEEVESIPELSQYMAVLEAMDKTFSEAWTEPESPEADYPAVEETE